MCVFAHLGDFGVKFHHIGLTLRFCTYSYPPLNYPRNPIFLLSSDEKHGKVLKKRIEKHSLGLSPLRVKIPTCSLTRRIHHDFLTRRGHWVNIFTQGENGRFDNAESLFSGYFTTKLNSLSFC